MKRKVVREGLRKSEQFVQIAPAQYAKNGHSVIYALTNQGRMFCRLWESFPKRGPAGYIWVRMNLPVAERVK